MGDGGTEELIDCGWGVGLLILVRLGGGAVGTIGTFDLT